MQLNNALRKVLITLKDYVDKMTPKKLSDLDIDIDLNSVKTINGQSPDENGNIEIETIVSWDELQNKPFDEEYSNIYYLEEQTVNIEEHSDLHQAWIDIPLNDLVYRDNKYTVVFDGIEYEATLYDAEGGAFIGISYYYPPDNRDNLPFGLWFSHFASKDNELYGLSQLAAICTTDDSLIGEHTISIYAEGLKINKIDEKYLPNSVLDIPELKDEISSLNSDLKEIVEVLPSKMDKENPTGSGSLNMNGKAGATIGNYSTVLGNNSMSVGESSIVSGHEVVSNNNYQSVFGKYNKYTTPYESVEETTAPMDISYSTPILVANSYIFDPFTGLFKLESPITTKIGSGGRYVNCYTSETDGWVEYVKRILSGSTNTGYRAGRKIYSKATENNVNYALMIGNGQSDEERSNAHILDWEGNANYAGDVYVGNANENKAGKKLATEEYVDNAVANVGSGSGNCFDMIADAKQEAIDTAAGDATTKANQALTDAKAYTDSLAGNYATAEQGALADSALQKEDITTGSANGTIAVDGTDVEVKGLGSAAYADTTAFDAAGVAEEKVNALANGVVADNTAAIAAINNVETGILKQAKDYVDTEVKELADGQVATNTAAITALQTTHAEDKATLQAGIDTNASAIAAFTAVTTDEVKALFA